METEEFKRILSGLVRTGKVMDIDVEKRKARVRFDSENFTSGWLYVIQHHAANMYIEPDAEHTHTIHDTYSGGGIAEKYEAHDHLPGSHLTWWMPKVNDTVLCIYLPIFDGDGFILGQIK